MRWNAAPPSRFDGALAAVSVTLLSRDEDVHHPVHLYSKSQGSSRRSILSKTAVHNGAVGPREPRRPSIVTPTETILLSTTVVPTPRSAHAHKPIASVTGLSPRSVGGQDEPQSGGLQEELSGAYEPKFIMCAGRALNAELPRGVSNNDGDKDGEHGVSLGRLSSRSGEVSTDATGELLKSQRGLQRSDSELELIISELREKIALQERQATPRSSDDDPAPSSGGSRPGSAHQHSRKHLKNPLERMDMSSSSSASLLRRQASTSQVTASRLVSEGTATMVTSAVLSSSASRGAISCHSQPTLPMNAGAEAHDTREKRSSEKMAHDGLRIRSYAGNDAASSQMPHFVSSTSLGLNLPSQLQPTRGQSFASETSETLSSFVPQMRPSRPRIRTLTDLELELERINDDSRSGDAGGSLSPVGPWLVDHDSNNSAPLVSARSTATPPGSPSSNQLSLTSEDAVLSPRSRLLWLSDCGSDDVWESTSARVLAMLRPGTRAPHGSRPASALDTRTFSNSKQANKTQQAAKPRAVSAKATPASRRNSTTSAGDSSVSGATTVATTVKNHRVRSNSSNSGSTGSASRQRIR